MKKILIISLLVFSLIGCNANNTEQVNAVEPAETTEAEVVTQDEKEVYHLEFDSMVIDLEKPLDVTVLDDLSKDDIALLRNAYYAKHGYAFKNEKNKDYFNGLEWYTPVDSFDEGLLSESDLEAIDAIIKYEKGGGHPVKETSLDDLVFVFYLNEQDSIEEYDNLIVFDKDHQIVFELSEHIEKFYGALTDIQAITAYDRRFYILAEKEFASSFSNKLILEHDGGLKIVFRDELEIMEWSDYNDDRQLDFFAMVVGGGQTSLDEGFGEVFINDGSTFVSSKRATRAYYYDQVDILMSAYKEDDSYENFDKVCRAQALTGKSFNSFLSDNIDMYSHLDDKDVDVFMTNYALKGPAMVEEYKARWDEYWLSIEKQPFEVPEEHKAAFFDLMFMEDLNIEAVLEYFGGDFDVISRTFYTEYIKDDIRIEFSKSHPIRIEYGGMLGFHLSVNKAIAYDNGYILVYAIGVDDYMTFVSKDKTIGDTYGVQGIVYDSIVVTDTSVEFNRLLDSNEEEKITIDIN